MNYICTKGGRGSPGFKLQHLTCLIGIRKILFKKQVKLRLTMTSRRKKELSKIGFKLVLKKFLIGFNWF